MQRPPGADTLSVHRAGELIAQLRELECQGLQEIMFATGVAGKWAFAEEFSRKVMKRL